VITLGHKCDLILVWSFQTPDEAFNFYNAYADHAGFNAHKDTCEKSKNDVSSMRFCCSNEGFSKRQIARQKSMGCTTDQKTLDRCPFLMKNIIIRSFFLHQKTDNCNLLSRQLQKRV
jgi:FAR1 DNA-binding domain